MVQSTKTTTRRKTGISSSMEWSEVNLGDNKSLGKQIIHHNLIQLHCSSLHIATSTISLGTAIEIPLQWSCSYWRVTAVIILFSATSSQGRRAIFTTNQWTQHSAGRSVAQQQPQPPPQQQRTGIDLTWRIFAIRRWSRLNNFLVFSTSWLQ